MVDCAQWCNPIKKFFQEILTDCGAIDCPVGTVCSCGQPLYQRCEIAGKVMSLEIYCTRNPLEILTDCGAIDCPVGTVCSCGQPLYQRCEIAGKF